MKTIPIFLSNELRILADALIEQLFSSFCKRKVVVPDSQMRNFLSLYIAENSSRKIAMGIELITLEQLKKENFGSRMQRALRLEHRIATSAKNEDFLSPVIKYLEASKTPLSLFCKELARVFEKYALYGENELENWRRKEGWQQRLWEEQPWTFILQEDYEWHLFGCNFLPKSYLDAFKERKTFLYILSPCAHFWEDLCTNKERMRLQQHLKLDAKEALENYLQDNNLLLANLGKLGRSFLKQLDIHDVIDLHQESGRGNALSELQNSFLNLQPIDNIIEDDSIRLYPVNSLFQEIECVFSTLYDLISKKGIEPREIHIMAKDISPYVPYIHMIFGRSNPKIPYAICDLDLSSENLFIKGLLQLFQIISHRFDPASIFKLCNNPAFYEKQKFSKSDRELLEEWAEKTCVRWGMDKAQRELFLKKTMLEESDAGTWEREFHQLLLGLCMCSATLPAIDISQAGLLEKWISCLRSLEEDVRPCIDGTQQTAAGWLLFIKELARKYFVVQEKDEQFLDNLDHLRNTLQDLNVPIFSFSSIYPILEKLLTAPSGSYNTSSIHTVLFSSFPQGSPLPKRLIWLLGMDEESFPGKEKYSSLSEFTPHAPTKADEGRYLFLECLLSAKDYFVASFVNISHKDHKELLPSLVIQELFSHLKRSLPKPVPIPHIHRINTQSSLPFFSSFFFPTQVQTPPEEKITKISIKKLETCAKHPLKFFFHERLKLYLERSKDQGEEFNLSNFNKAELRKKMLRYDAEQVLKEASLQGKMPLGPFKAVAELRLEEEMKKGQLLIPEDVFSYDLRKNPLQIGSLTITGVLEEISSSGLLFYGDDSLQSLVRIWPLYLVFLCAPVSVEKKDLLLLKKGKRLFPPEEDPRILLQKYLDYYQLCLHFPSPLIPHCAKALLEGSGHDLKKAFYEATAPFEDDYLEWILRRDPEIPCSIIHENWSKPLQETFTPLLQWKKQ